MHYIRYEDLYDVVLNDIRQYAELAKNHEQEFVEAISKTGSDNAKKQLVQHEKEITKAEKRLSEISLITKRLYEDSVMGKLTDERFSELSKEYEVENAELKSRVNELQKVTASCREATDNSQKFTVLIRKYIDIQELTATILNDIVSKIMIHEREVFDGERHQKIDIYYNFVGVLNENRSHLLHDRRCRVSS